MSDELEYLSKWKSFQARNENHYTRQFIRALQQQINQFVKSKDPNKITSAPIYKVLVDLYKNVGVNWAHKTVLDLRTQKARLPMGFSERIVELMRQYYGIDLLNDAELMTQHSRDVIVTVLSEAAQTGASFSEIVKILQQNSEFSAIRARRIARTETVTAANGAAIINAKESGLSLTKKWLRVNDKRIRDDHRDVTGKTVDIDEPFKVGDVYMDQPGARKQPNGFKVPKEQVINCRCVLGFRGKRDANGRLITT